MPQQKVSRIDGNDRKMLLPGSEPAAIVGKQWLRQAERAYAGEFASLRTPGNCNKKHAAENLLGWLFITVPGDSIAAGHWLLCSALLALSRSTLHSD